jgi:hypothetical protein
MAAIENNSSCSNPSSVAASGVTKSSAIVSWASVSGDVSGYTIRYRVSDEKGTGDYITQSLPSTTLNYNIAGLEEDRSYSGYVQSVCGGIPSSGTGFTFRTLKTQVVNTPPALYTPIVFSGGGGGGGASARSVAEQVAEIEAVKELTSPKLFGLPRNLVIGGAVLAIGFYLYKSGYFSK